MKPMILKCGLVFGLVIASAATSLAIRHQSQVKLSEKYTGLEEQQAAIDQLFGS